MGLFRASNQAQAPSGAAANLRTAACTDVAINYPRSHWGPAPEGRRQRLQPRTGARNRQLILVSSLTGRWACWACGAGWLLLQRGSLLPFYPSFPSVLSPRNFACPTPSPFLPLLVILVSSCLSTLSSHLPRQHGSPKLLRGTASTPKAGLRLVPACHTRLPAGAQEPVQGPLARGHPVPQSQGPTSWLSRE